MLPSLPQEPRLSDSFAAVKGGLGKIFEHYDQQRQAHAQKLSQYMGRVQDTLLKLSSDQTSDPTTFVVAAKTFNVTGGVLTQVFTTGPDFTVVALTGADANKFRVTLPEGYESSALLIAFTLGEVPETSGQLSGARSRTQLGGDIGITSFVSGRGAERVVWAGDARFASDPTIPLEVSDVYHVPQPISRLHLEVI
jgi:hypothetical protein